MPLDFPQRFGRAAARFRARHAVAVAAALAVVLGGFGAIALAVAPATPEPDLPAQHTVNESLLAPSGDLAAQVEALAEQELLFDRTEVSRGSDSVAAALRRLGVQDAAAAQALARDRVLAEAFAARGSRIVQARSNRLGRLKQLVVRQAAEAVPGQPATQFVRLTATPADGGWSVQRQTLPLTLNVRVASGTVRSSLFAATDDARVPDAVATQLAEVFGSEIDFHRELRKGDTFTVMYEAATADGEPAPWLQGSGRLLAAEFVNDGTTHQAIWFAGTGNAQGAYYDGQGRSRKRPFLASPLEFSRVTSGFAVRVHPILHTLRAHKGVDYGAPTGTPVRSVGDGVVVFAGRMGGYGNRVEVRHRGDRSTVYAHLQRIDVRVGQHLEQGQNLGTVGATGMATGPHLHFEFMVGSTQQDPLIAAREAERERLDGPSLARFTAFAGNVRERFDLAQQTRATRRSFE